MPSTQPIIWVERDKASGTLLLASIVDHEKTRNVDRRPLTEADRLTYSKQTKEFLSNEKTPK